MIARPDGAQLRLPQGFPIEQYATGFEKPRFMIPGLSGEILISDAANPGKVYALVDGNKDFKAEDKKVVLEGLDWPYGLALWRDYLYVGEPTGVKHGATPG